MRQADAEVDSGKERVTESAEPPARRWPAERHASDVDMPFLSHPDSNAPTWANMVNGQVNLYDAVR
jgi:malate synthase